MSTFEAMIRDKISQTTLGPERNFYKLILGECQNIINAPSNKKGELTDDMGFNILKKMISSNDECIGHLKIDDPRYSALVKENELLNQMLPQYWSKDKIKDCLAGSGVDLTTVNEGQATGLAMKHLKSIDAVVEGGTVRQVVAEIRGQ